MSAGPIRKAQEARSSTLASNTGSSALHAPGAAGRAYCGRRTTSLAKSWASTTCSDCLAARRADQEAEKGQS
jgi:hypothetical protein